MVFKSITNKIRRAILCGKGDKAKQPLEIGSPTDMRHVDFSEAPGLTEADKNKIRAIRKETACDATYVLALQSHPQTQSTTPQRSPSLSTASTSPSASASNTPQVNTPTHPLLNAASSNLPSSLPTPPRRHHTDSSPPPTSRMKSVWEGTRRLSTGLAGHRSSAGYHELDTLNRTDQTVNVTVTVSDDEQADNKIELIESYVKEGTAYKLDLGLDFEDGKGLGIDSQPVSSDSESGGDNESCHKKDGGVSGSFEKQSTFGGMQRPPLEKIPKIAGAIRDTEIGDSSESASASEWEDDQQVPLIV